MEKINHSIQITLYFLAVLAIIHGTYASVLDGKFYYHIYVVAAILWCLGRAFEKDKNQNYDNR